MKLTTVHVAASIDELKADLPRDLQVRGGCPLVHRSPTTPGRRARLGRIARNLRRAAIQVSPPPHIRNTSRRSTLRRG